MNSVQAQVSRVSSDLEELRGKNRYLEEWCGFLRKRSDDLQGQIGDSENALYRLEQKVEKMLEELEERIDYLEEIAVI